MKLREKIDKAFTFKSNIEELENVYIPFKTVDANPNASFNEKAQGMKEMKEDRLKQLTIEDNVQA